MKHRTSSGWMDGDSRRRISLRAIRRGGQCCCGGGGAGGGVWGGGRGVFGGLGGVGLVSQWAVRVVAGSPGDHHWPWAHQSQQFEIQYCSATRVVPQSAEDWSWVYQSRS